MSLADDPFAVLDVDPAGEVALEPPGLDETLEAKSDKVPSGSVFVFDLETVPDESRFPRPVRVEKVKRPDVPGINLNNLVKMTVPTIKAQIPLLSEGQLMQLMEIESKSPKPRSGVTDAINNQVAIDNADDFEIAMMEWRKLSFSPFCCRIVALGIKAKGHSVTMLAKNDDEERELLRVLWQHIDKFNTRCGYNITAFDDAVLVFRSMILGVSAPKLISRKRFNDRNSIDLMTAMFPTSGFNGNGKKKEDAEDAPDYDIINGQSRKLKDVCLMLGIVPLAGYEMSGDKVFDLVEAGDWDGIAAYVESDAVIEFELYQRLSDYIVF